MRRLLIATVVAAALVAGPAISQVDPRISEFCLKAQDFKGCIESMSKPATAIETKQDKQEDQRTWVRNSGVVVRMKVSSVKAMRSSNGDYGRHIKWVYGRDGVAQTQSNYWGSVTHSGNVFEVQADCKEYTADWNNDMAGWRPVRDPGKYRRNKDWYEPVIEAKQIMDEFCPQIGNLARD